MEDLLLLKSWVTYLVCSLQRARSASERKRVNRRVNQRFLTALVEMGIPEEQAELALSETGNVGVEVATEWLFRCEGLWVGVD